MPPREPTDADRPGAAPPPAGSAMDTPITRSRWSGRAGRLSLAGGGLACVAIVLGLLVPQRWATFVANSQTLPADRATISQVVLGRFDDFIPLRGQAVPLDTVYLDAVEGGRVERKLVEDGSLVEEGQPLAVLANSSLRLEVIRSESEVTQQLNTLRSIELQIERNRADNQRLLAELRWQLKRASDRAARDQQLASVGFVSPAALQEGADERAYLLERLAVTQDNQRTDERLQSAQAEQLRTATQQMQANLSLARSNLEALTVKAPTAGRLTAFDITVGQSLTRGQRIGQIDSEARYKLLVQIDEFYLSRVAVGQAAVLELDGKSHPMRMRRLNPQVRAGQFEAELVFDDAAGAAPATLRRGQTLQARLALGDSGQALLLPAGAFLSESGGSFVFVVEGSQARKRAVQLGRRNLDVVEVLAGLKAGERVITSSYAGLADKDLLLLSS